MDPWYTDDDEFIPNESLLIDHDDKLNKKNKKPKKKDHKKHVILEIALFIGKPYVRLNVIGTDTNTINPTVCSLCIHFFDRKFLSSHIVV